MPSAVQTSVINSGVSYMLKERPQDPIVPAFTPVNGKNSPPSHPRTNGVSGMTVESNHVRPLNTTNQVPDNKGTAPASNGWTPAPRVGENGHHHHSVSPTPSIGSSEGSSTSPTSPGKRKRSDTSEDSGSDLSQDRPFSQPRLRLDSYAPVGGNNTTYASGRAQTLSMDTQQQQQQRTLPPIDRPEHDRNWHPQQPQEGRHSSYPESHYQDSRAMESSQNGSQSVAPTQINGQPDSQNPIERSSTTEMTRAGVQVDPKKRKRQFANRTKTGCGTCRRRKKKCDEGKPECNNCQRGGFICEGYQSKIPWPNNGMPKPPPPLQSKDQFSSQRYHNHGTSREAYPDQNGQPPADGGRAQPIVVDDNDRRNGWGQNWAEPPRPSHPPEQHHQQPAEYNHQPTMGPHPRPPSNDHHTPQTPQPAPQRQHNPRIYHHTPQTMSHVVNNSPTVTDGSVYHPSQHTHQAPHGHPHAPAVAQGPPPPPPNHYAPPPPQLPQKTEKEKMLNYEPFLPYTESLTKERQRCKSLCYQFNNTSNHNNELAKGSLERHFRAIFTPWARDPRRTDQAPSHVGLEVAVDTPFYCDYGYNVSIGDRVSIGTNAKFMDSGRITIGRNTTIGPNVTIDTVKVPTNHKDVKGSHGSVTAAEVIIGDNVYIGANVTICAGVKIGTGAIVHPGSVVVRDVPRDVTVRGPSAEVRSVYYDE